MRKRVPRLKSDKDAETFLAQDLSGCDFSQFKVSRFEFEKKDTQLNMQLPEPVLASVKTATKARGIPYTRRIRETIEQAVIVSSK